MSDTKRKKKGFVNSKMLDISEQVEKIFQWGKEILSFIKPLQDTCPAYR